MPNWNALLSLARTSVKVRSNEIRSVSPSAMVTLPLSVK